MKVLSFGKTVINRLRVDGDIVKLIMREKYYWYGEDLYGRTVVSINKVDGKYRVTIGYTFVQHYYYAEVILDKITVDCLSGIEVKDKHGHGYILN